MTEPLRTTGAENSMSRALAEAFLSSSGEAMIALGLPDCCIIECNPAAERLLGATAAELIGWPGLFLFEPPDSIVKDRNLPPGVFLSSCKVRMDFESANLGRPTGESVLVTGSILPGTGSGEAHVMLLIRKLAPTPRDHVERLLDMASAIVVVLSPDGEILSFNKGAETLTGYARADLIGRNWFDTLVPGEGHPQSWRTGQQAVGEFPATFESPILTKDGLERYIKWQNSELTRDGRVIGTVSLGVDLTDRIQAERALLQSETRFRMIFESSRDAIGISLRGQHVLVNAAYTGMFGYDRASDLGGTSILDCIAPDEQAGIMAKVSARARGEEMPASYETRGKRRDGSEFPMEVRGSSYVLGGEQYTLVVLRDIAERKAVEEAIRRSESNLLAVVENSRDSILSFDRNYKIITINTVAGSLFERLLGFQPKAGQMVLELIPESLRQKWAQRYDRALAGEYFTLEEEFVEGDIRYHGEYSLNPIRDGDSVTGVCIFGRDITERKRAEDTLRRIQKMDAVGRLTGGIAHDFNNLLGVILGNTDLLEADTDRGTPAAGRIGDIRRAAERGAELTKQMLRFARRSPEKEIVTDINSIIERMEGLAVRAISAAIQVETALATDLWWTQIDPGDFEDALLNLILNARDAMPGGGHLRLETLNRQADEEYRTENPDMPPGDYVELAVSDTGHGIPDQLRDRIFEPFFTTRAPGHGTGLGLAMVFAFVERSGGHIRVQTKIDHGSTFRLYLPRSHETPARREASDQISARIPGGIETILVVDDEVLLLRLASGFLERMGYRVQTAGDGNEAIRKLESDSSIALIFSDVVMPGGINGYELAARAAQLRPLLPVLLTSGYAQEGMSTAGQPVAKREILSKPYALSELARRVRVLLDVAAAQRE